MEPSLEEKNFQKWRAIARIRGQHSLICLGANIKEIRDCYMKVIGRLFPKPELTQISEIRLEKWSGLPNRGRWVFSEHMPFLPQLLGLDDGEEAEVA